MLPGLPFGLPFRVPGSGFRIRFGCPVGSGSRSGVGFGTRPSHTQGQWAGWGKTGDGGGKAWVCWQTTKCTAASARFTNLQRRGRHHKEKRKAERKRTRHRNPNGDTNGTEKVENETEAKTEDPGEAEDKAEDKTETKWKQKRNMKHTATLHPLRVPCKCAERVPLTDPLADLL